jgi:cytochrome c
MKVMRFVVAMAMFCLVQSIASRVSADEYATKDEAMALVKHAMARVAEVGMDKAKPEFMDHGGKFIDRDLYLIVIDQAGVRVVHGQNPKLVGKTYYDAVDVNGKEYGNSAARRAR